MFFVVAAQAPDRQGSQNMTEENIKNYIAQETPQIRDARPGPDAPSLHLYNVSDTE